MNWDIEQLVVRYGRNGWKHEGMVCGGRVAILSRGDTRLWVMMDDPKGIGLWLREGPEKEWCHLWRTNKREFPNLLKMNQDHRVKFFPMKDTLAVMKGDKTGEAPKADDAYVREALDLLDKLAALEKTRKLERMYERPYKGEGTIGPYPWQCKFHKAGEKFADRCIMAGNRVGKTEAASAEVAIHLTGRYPVWWEGRVFPQPIRAWSCSITNELARDVSQKALIGNFNPNTNLWEDGWIPPEDILEVQYRQAGISGVVDQVKIRHKSGGVSMLQFKSYEQGRAKFQGTSIHVAWMDEEPPEDIFSETLTRTADCQGITVLSFTPLMGMTSVAGRYYESDMKSWTIMVGWDDAPHLTDPEKERMLSQYPEHERLPRSTGQPISGSGVIYPIDESMIKYRADTFPEGFPSHFSRICGIDFGVDHPFAAVWLAHDRDTDSTYLYDVYTARGQGFAVIADAIKQRGEWIPVAWPHDGMQREKSSGIQLAEQLKRKGVNMLHFSARYTNDKGGAQPTEPIVQNIHDRMGSGKFFVAAHLTEWFREKRMYHRKDGLIFRKNDDIMSATNYAMMMLRYAKPFQKPNPLPEAVVWRPW